MSDALDDALRRARAASNLNRHELALEEASRAAAIDPSCSDAHAYIALALQQLGRYRGSAEAARRAAGLDPDGEWPHRLLAQALYCMNQTAEAEREIREALRLRPDVSRGLALLADILVDTKRLAEAMATLKHLLNIEPTAENHAQLADLYQTQSMFELAEHHYRESLRENPHSARVQYELGWIHFRRGERRQARALFESAILLSPSEQKYKDSFLDACGILKAPPPRRSASFLLIVLLLAPLAITTMMRPSVGALLMWLSILSGGVTLRRIVRRGLDALLTTMVEILYLLILGLIAGVVLTRLSQDDAIWSMVGVPAVCCLTTYALYWVIAAARRGLRTDFDQLSPRTQSLYLQLIADRDAARERLARVE